MLEELNETHRLIYTCSRCGGDDIHFDAMVSWDEETEQFDIISVADSKIMCMDCYEDVEPKKVWIELHSS